MKQTCACHHCVVDGGWSSWTCGSCSKTCGDGTMRCNRICNNPRPYCGGNSCLGLSVAERSCNNNNSGMTFMHIYSCAVHYD